MSQGGWGEHNVFMMCLNSVEGSVWHNISWRGDNTIEGI